MGRLFKDSKLYAIDSSQSTVKEIAQYYHRGQPVSMMYHKGKLVYEASSPSDYVQEGLLFELDCKRGVSVDDNGFVEKWKPVVGKYNLEYTNEYKFKVIDGGIGGTYDNSGSYFANLASFNDINLTDYTIEICLLPETGRPPMSVFAFNGSNKLVVSFSLWDTQIAIKDKNTVLKADKYIPSSTEGLQRISITNDDVLYNGEVLSLVSASMEESTSLNKITIAPDVASIYSIRVYDRKLSQEEREKNAAIDQKRFEIPPVPENALWIDGGVLVLDNGAYLCVDK